MIDLTEMLAIRERMQVLLHEVRDIARDPRHPDHKQAIKELSKMLPFLIELDLSLERLFRWRDQG